MSVSRMQLEIFTLFFFAPVEPGFNEVAGDCPNLFVKWRVRLRRNNQNVRYIEVIVND